MELAPEISPATANKAQDHEKDWREYADLLICRQDANRYRRHAHEEHADNQNCFPSMGIAPVPQNEGTDWPGNVANTICRQRRDDGHGWIFRWKEYLREDQRRRCGVDKEIIIFERGANPSTRSGLL
jgi:hypothetical protein